MAPADAAVGDDPAGAAGGVTATALGTVTRPGGALQVTFEGMPLYRFFGDTKSGDTKGQGVDGTWFVVSPTATPAAAPAAPASGSSSPTTHRAADGGGGPIRRRHPGHRTPGHVTPGHRTPGHVTPGHVTARNRTPGHRTPGQRRLRQRRLPPPPAAAMATDGHGYWAGEEYRGLMSRARRR